MKGYGLSRDVVQLNPWRNFLFVKTRLLKQFKVKGKQNNKSEIFLIAFYK